MMRSTRSAGVLGHSAHEVATAETQLLTSNLASAKRISDTMGVSLTSFDDRLARLERSCQGLHASTTRLSKTTRNIEAAMAAVDALLGQYDVADQEMAVVSRAPRVDNLPAYQASLDKLVQALGKLRAPASGVSGISRGGEQDESAQKMVRRRCLTALMPQRLAVEQGAKQLGKICIDWSTDATDAQLASGSATIPHAQVERIVNLLAYIRGLPGGPAVEKDLQRPYGELRGSYLASLLEPLRDLPTLLDRLIGGARAELALAGDVFQPFAASYIYRHIIPPALAVFANRGQSILATVRREQSATRAVDVAFSCFGALQAHADDFDDVVRAKASRKENELGELLHAFRGSCLRCLPEVIEEARVR